MPFAAIFAFFGSPVGKVVMIGLAIFAAYGYVDRKATFRERARCESAKIQSRLDAANRDLDIAKKAEESAVAALRELTEEKKQAEDENAKLKSEIDKLPVDQQCLLPDRRQRMRK